MSGLDSVSRWSYAFWILDFIEFFESLPYPKKLSKAYKDFLFLSLKDYTNNINDDPILELEINKEFNRAIFVGIKPEKIPATCETAFLIKFLTKYQKEILNSIDQNQYQNAYTKMKSFFTEIKNIFSTSITINPEYSKFSKEELLHYQSFFKLVNWILYEDAEYFHEHQELTPDYLVLVAELLKFYENKSPVLKEILKDVNLTEFCSGENNSERFRILQLLQDKTIDATKFFDTYGKTTAINKAQLMLIIKEKTTLHQPTEFEKLSKLFLWYTRIEVLEAGDNIFSGLPVFESLINGLAIKLKENNLNTKLQMLEFIHPEEKNTHRSIAVLIEAYGTISDMSGWLIFRNVGGPYAGLGGTIYEGIKQTIQKNKKYINLKKCEDISYDTLDKYLKSKYKYEEEIIYYGDAPEDLDEDEYTDYQQIQKFEENQTIERKTLDTLKETTQLLGTTIGELLELILYKYCCNTYGHEKTSHSIKLKKKDPEIDLLAEDQNGNPNIFEVSIKLPIPSTEIPKIKTKINAIQTNQKYNSKTIKTHYIVTTLAKEYGEFQKIKKEYEKENITVVIFEDLIDQLPEKDLSKDKVNKYKKIIKQYQKLTK